MKTFKINDVTFEIIENHNDAINNELLAEMLTDYFEHFDYVLGDWAYGKLRLKGFYSSENKKVKDMNNINNYQSYLQKYCAYGCRYFLIKRV